MPFVRNSLKNFLNAYIVSPCSLTTSGAYPKNFIKPESTVFLCMKHGDLAYSYVCLGIMEN